MPKLTKIDDLYRGDYAYLDESDSCYFLREYLGGMGYEGGETNQLIANFKIKPSVRTENPHRWRWKLQAIDEIANELGAALGKAFLTGKYTLIPIPPSKSRDDPEFDDRMLQVLRVMCRNSPYADVRDMIIQRESMDADHTRDGPRAPPHQRARYYDFDQVIVDPPATRIVLFDDLITTGSHFKALKQRLREIYPGAQIYGIFVARVIHADFPFL
jgi:hypothetical protein